MNIKRIVLNLSAAALAGACTTTAPETISSLGGQYTITQNGSSFTTTGTPSVGSNGILDWVEPGFRAIILDTADFTTASVVDRTDGNKNYSIITGTPTPNVPTSGSATYAGQSIVIRTTAAHGGNPYSFTAPQTSNVDFGAGTVIGSGFDGFAYTATISGTSINGTMQFTADGAVTAPLEGGFYGTDKLAGVFSAPTIVGHFFGTAP